MAPHFYWCEIRASEKQKKSRAEMMSARVPTSSDELLKVEKENSYK